MWCPAEPHCRQGIGEQKEHIRLNLLVAILVVLNDYFILIFEKRNKDRGSMINDSLPQKTGKAEACKTGGFNIKMQKEKEKKSGPRSEKQG